MIESLLEADRLLALGLTDQAERIYRQAVETDPRSAIAVVGLSRVALERGDDRVALDLARRALVIDPENPAAARMTARLEEIIATRGEEVPTWAPDTAADAVSAAPPSPSSGGSPAPAPAPASVPAPAPSPTPVHSKKRRGLLGRLLGGR